jgi:hypothetical protein
MPSVLLRAQCSGTVSRSRFQIRAPGILGSPLCCCALDFFSRSLASTQVDFGGSSSSVSAPSVFPRLCAGLESCSRARLCERICFDADAAVLVFASVSCSKNSFRFRARRSKSVLVLGFCELLSFICPCSITRLSCSKSFIESPIQMIEFFLILIVFLLWFSVTPIRYLVK